MVRCKQHSDSAPSGIKTCQFLTPSTVTIHWQTVTFPDLSAYRAGGCQAGHHVKDRAPSTTGPLGGRHA